MDSAYWSVDFEIGRRCDSKLEHRSSPSRMPLPSERRSGSLGCQVRRTGRADRSLFEASGSRFRNDRRGAANSPHPLAVRIHHLQRPQGPIPRRPRTRLPNCPWCEGSASRQVGRAVRSLGLQARGGSAEAPPRAQSSTGRGPKSTLRSTKFRRSVRFWNWKSPPRSPRCRLRTIGSPAGPGIGTWLGRAAQLFGTAHRQALRHPRSGDQLRRPAGIALGRVAGPRSSAPRFDAAVRRAVDARILARQLEPQQHRRGDVHRAIGAGNQTDQHREGKGVNRLAAKM